MVSASYRFVKGALRLIPVKRFLSGDPERLIKICRKINNGKSRGFQIPKDPGFAYDSRAFQTVDGDRRALIIRPEASPRKALLYLFGGGMVTEPDRSDLRPALRFARETGRETWFPFYPLCLVHGVMPAIRMTLDCYRAMLETFRPEDICVLGYSSGTILAFGLYRLIREHRPDLPLPGKMILLSPGAVVDDPAWRARVMRLAPNDILMSPAFLDSVGTILSRGEPIPDWVLNPWIGGLDGFPPCHLWFGSDEVLAASIPNFEEALKKAGVPYTLTVGEGMCHCYPVISGPSFPEKEAATKELIKQINE